MTDKNLESLRKTIQEQKKIINFFQEKFQEHTGNTLPVPSTWSKFLDIKDKNAPISDDMGLRKTSKGIVGPQGMIDDKEPHTDHANFIQAFYALNLPQKKMEDPKDNNRFRISSNSYRSNNRMMRSRGAVTFGSSFPEGKKRGLSTTFDSNNPFHMVEKIDLSGYVNKNQRIKYLDLSENDIGRQGGLLIGKLLREGEMKLEWLDISRNNFHYDQNIIEKIVDGLRFQRHLYHLSIDVSPKKVTSPKYLSEFTISEKITQMLLNNPKLRSLSLIDSYITQKAMTNVQKALCASNRMVTSLNFKFSFLDLKQIHLLCRGLEMTRSLVKLNLSSNGLAPLSGIYIVKALHENLFLNDLNLSRNNLNDDFAIQLAKCLKVNDILYRVDISNNPIGEIGAEAILKALTESNDSLCSLGDIQSNTSMGILNIQNITMCLCTNDTIKDYSQERRMEENEVTKKPIELQTRLKVTTSNATLNNYDGYQIMKPLAFLNGPKKTFGEFKLWNV